jgi:hypothetical protein
MKDTAIRLAVSDALDTLAGPIYEWATMDAGAMLSHCTGAVIVSTTALATSDDRLSFERAVAAEVIRAVALRLRAG